MRNFRALGERFVTELAEIEIEAATVDEALDRGRTAIYSATISWEPGDSFPRIDVWTIHDEGGRIVYER